MEIDRPMHTPVARGAVGPLQRAGRRRLLIAASMAVTMFSLAAPAAHAAGGTITAVVDTAAAPRDWQGKYQEFVKSTL